MDVPQPASEPNSLGDQVQIYLAEEDPDAEYLGTAGTIGLYGSNHFIDPALYCIGPWFVEEVSEPQQEC